MESHTKRLIQNDSKQLQEEENLSRTSVENVQNDKKYNLRTSANDVRKERKLL